MPSKVYYPGSKTGPRPKPETLVAQAAGYADSARQAVSGALAEIVGVLELARDSQDAAKVDKIMSKVWPAVVQAQEAASYSASAARAARAAAITTSNEDQRREIYESAMKNAIAAADMAVEYAVDSKQ